MAVNYFLGANTPSGFVSLFDEWIAAPDTERVYIIKGAPGSGKSTLMKKIAAAAEDAGEKVEHIYCSADPSSLDGIRLCTLGVLMVDGTAPHVVEPRYPYAVEAYLNIGDFVSAEGVRERKDELVGITAAYKCEMAAAGRSVSAAASVRENIRSIVTSDEVIEKITKRARGVVRREITKGPMGLLRRRYLSGLSSCGETVFLETPLSQCGRIYALDNSFGLARHFLAPVISAALEAGQETVVCLNPLDGSPEHLILPGLSLAFVSGAADRLRPFEPYRHIRLDATVPPERIKSIRQKLKFLRKTYVSLVEDAVSSMSRAKKIHDEMEKLYIPHIDFASLDTLSDSIGAELTAELLGR